MKAEIEYAMLYHIVYELAHEECTQECRDKYPLLCLHNQARQVINKVNETPTC